MKRTMFTLILCAMLAAGVDAETKIADCTRENVTDVGLLDGKTPVVCYYTEEQGLISMVRKYYVDIGGKTEGPYEHEQNYKDIERKFTQNKKPPYTIFNGGWYVITENQKYGPYNEVSDVILAPDDKTYAYIALKSNSYGGTLYVITRERVEGPYYPYFGLDNIADKLHIRFSPDSKMLAYVAHNDNTSDVVVVNGEKSEPYPYSEVYGFMFSADSKTLAYTVRDIQYGTEYVVVGKEKTYGYKGVSYRIFSPDGKLFAYVAKIDGEWYVVVGKEKAGPYDDINGLAFSPDSKRLIYIAKQCDEDQGYYVFSGMEKMGPYQDAKYLRLSHDGKLLAYAAEIDDKWYVIKNGEKIGPCDGIQDLMFSSDGETLVYKVYVRHPGSTGQYYIAAGEYKSAEYKRIFPIMFLNGGKEVAYWAEDNSTSWYLVCGKDVDGPYDSQKSEWNDDKRIYEAKPYVTEVSPDGKKLVYTAKKDDKWYLVVGKDKVGPCDDISWPTFSSDGDIFGYSVKTKDEPTRNYLLIDGIPYTGGICAGRAVYLKDGAIWAR